jgi:hypothetical protein
MYLLWTASTAGAYFEEAMIIKKALRAVDVWQWDCIHDICTS